MKHGATRWLGHLVNTFGQGWRLGLRGLGAIDETLKTINYNSWAYGEIMMTMPSRVKKASPEIRSLWVKNQMEKMKMVKKKYYICRPDKDLKGSKR